MLVETCSSPGESGKSPKQGEPGVGESWSSLKATQGRGARRGQGQETDPGPSLDFVESEPGCRSLA